MTNGIAKPNILYIFSQIIFGAFVAISFLIIILLSIPVYCFRVFVILISKCQTNTGKILDPISSFLANDLSSGSPPRCNIVITMLFSNHLSPESVRHDILANWINAKDTSGNRIYPKFQQYPHHRLGFIFWKQSDFEINNHVFIHASKSVTDTDLDVLTEQLLNAPFKRDTSPWEIHLVYNYKNKDLYPDAETMTVFVLKFHHSLSDGYSILFALANGLMKSPMIQLPTPRFPKRTAWEQVCFWGSMPLTIFKELSVSYAHLMKPCPWKVPNNKKSHQIYAKSNAIPIQKIKDVKNRAGVSFTSVLVSAISAAISDNLEEKRKSGGVKGDAKSMFCFSPLPVPGHIGSHQTLTNKLTGTAFEIPTGHFSCLDRLRKCDSIVETKKNSGIPQLFSFFTCGVGWHLSSVSRLLMNGTSVMSTGLTNFPSLPQMVSKDVNTCLSVYPAMGCCVGSSGAQFMIVSYNEQIRFALVADQAVLTRQEITTILNKVTEEVDKLYVETSNRNLLISCKEV